MAAHSYEVVGTMYRHRIDAGDRITEVSDNWDAFARANSAPDTCLSSNVLGTKLWDHIRDGETGHLYNLRSPNWKRGCRRSSARQGLGCPLSHREAEYCIAYNVYYVKSRI